MQRSTDKQFFRRHLGRRLVPALLLALACSAAHTQNVPVFSGGAAALGGVNAGSPTIQTVIDPVVAAPMGSHLLLESRADIRGVYTQTGRTGPYNGSTFASLQYLQLDYIAAPKLTIVAGRFITPFGTYNERLEPVWISNFQDAPAIVSIGTGTKGSGDGAQVRGALITSSKVQLNYIGYFSALETGPKFKAARGAGYRFDLFFPTQRLEIGTSFTRTLQGVRNNSEGVHVWWQPYRVPLSFRSEFAHGYHSAGYWFETAYRLSQWGGTDSLIGRLEPVFRMQETFRNSPNTPGQADGLPSVGTQQADFAFDYHLPKEIRLNTSYSRFFSSTGNHNIWEIGMTYRLLFPAWKGHS